MCLVKGNKCLSAVCCPFSCYDVCFHPGSIFIDVGKAIHDEFSNIYLHTNLIRPKARNKSWEWYCTNFRCTRAPFSHINYRIVLFLMNSFCHMVAGSNVDLCAVEILWKKFLKYNIKCQQIVRNNNHNRHNLTVTNLACSDFICSLRSS